MTRYLGLSAIALLAGLGAASAQQAPASAQQPQPAQHNEQAKPAQAGAEEPSSRAPTTKPLETDVLVDGRLAVPGAPQDSQTVPSKFSPHNAEIDALPTMAMPLGLTDAQKHRIAESVAKTNAPVEPLSAKPADMLPATTHVEALPQDVTAEIPSVRDLKVVRTRDKILLVRSASMVVVGEIAN